jgi:hypothetical protein
MSAAGIDAGLMYLFDPDHGKRRRGEIGDAAKHVNRIATDAAGKTRRERTESEVGSRSERRSVTS